MKTSENESRASIAIDFMSDLSRVHRQVGVTTKDGHAISLEPGLADGISLMRHSCENGNKLIFIGNGGSAAIASHQAVDYWKNGGLEAIAFNDASLLTCISNDFGYERVFAEPIKRFARRGDVLLAISSSGQSRNILEGVQASRELKCRVITLSGFEETNPLRTMGDLNFYVPSRSYGIVEISHLVLLHAMLEDIMHSRAAGKG
jgi:D-sedoheptulose 7-phosphate isomerase